MGRLFDAAAAVLGLRHVSRYEGQAAMELESAAGARPAMPAAFPVVATADGWQLDPLPLLTELGERAKAGEPVETLAAVFHESVAEAAADVAARVAEAEGIATVALGGGVFQNARLLETVTARLERRRLRAIVPRALSPNDGAISYGQAAVAAARLAAER
jgi:hydrogenase maturation protein HypF